MLQVGVLKQLTGGDVVIARFMRRNPVSFPLIAAICVGSNKEMPFVDNSDVVGIRARRVRFPFKFTI